MATGDAAAAVGMDVVPGTADRRQGFEEINKTRDYLAEHRTTGGHPWDKITAKPNVVTSPGTQAMTLRYDARPVVGRDGAEVEMATYGELVGVANTAAAAQTAANAAAAAVGGKANAFSGADTVRAAQGPTTDAYGRTVSGGNFAVWMDTTLQFGRNVSSRRYKEDIEPHPVDPAAVLALRPVTYHRIDDPDAGAREYGLIAEDVNELLPSIVTWFDGQIDGVRYELLGVALLAVVKDQDAQLRALREEIAALREQITAPTEPTEPEPTEPTPEEVPDASGQ